VDDLIGITGHSSNAKEAIGTFDRLYSVALLVENLNLTRQISFASLVVSIAIVIEKDSPTEGVFTASGGLFVG
jgi:hypothetical protein